MHSSSLQIFKRMMAETFFAKNLEENTLDNAQRLFWIESFLTFFASQQDLDINNILHDKAFFYSKSRFNAHHFWEQLAKFVTFPRDNKLRYSESIETLWRWYEENKDNIDKIITIPKAERLDEKYKKIIIENFTLLHTKLNEKEHKLNLAKRLNVKNSNVKKITQYINQLTAIYLSYTVIRIELGYKEDKFSNTSLLKHMKHFHRARRHKPALFKKLCGYITKLEYSYYNGYYWRTLLFFNELSLDDVETYSRHIGEYWNKIVVKEGGDYLTKDDYLNVKEGQIELLEEHLCATFFRETTLDAAHYLCEKDAICRPNVSITKLLRTGQIRIAKKVKVVPESIPRGRKRLIDRERVTQLKLYGLGATEIAKQLDISRSSVCKILKLQKSTTENKAE